MIVAELPIGSQSADAMKSYGFVLSLLAVCKKMQSCFVTVTPREVKVTFTGNSEAAKREMIAEAVKRYPAVPWPMMKRKGEMIVVEGIAEHIADAIAALDFVIESQLNQRKGNNP
jgi:Holliday junction resolvasome RuvABC endonuclease subunit